MAAAEEAGDKSSSAAVPPPLSSQPVVPLAPHIMSHCEITVIGCMFGPSEGSEMVMRKSTVEAAVRDYLMEPYELQTTCLLKY